jgi:hypothetical protein
MQNEHTSIQKMDEHAVSPYIKRLLKRLEELWQSPHEPTFETLKRIIVDLPEEDQLTGIKALAEYLTSIMKIRFHDIMATFHQKAEEEGISAEERDEIIRDIRQESFQTLQKLSGLLSVQSVKDLVMLGNITIGLYKLTQVESAEQAERWMYKLPKMYYDKLEHEHLVIEPPQVTVTISADLITSAISWDTSLSQSSATWTWTYNLQELVPVQPKITQRPLSLVA